MFTNLAFLILTSALYLFAVTISPDIFFAPLYFALPLLWLLWIFSILRCSNKTDFLHVLINWALISASLLMLLMNASLSTHNLYGSHGIDVVMLVANMPVILPFGGFIWYLIDIFLIDLGVYINALATDDYFKIWIEMLIVSALQGLVIFILQKPIHAISTRHNTKPDPPSGDVMVIYKVFFSFFSCLHRVQACAAALPDKGV